jgi:hypothetical protein
MEYDGAPEKGTRQRRLSPRSANEAKTPGRRRAGHRVFIRTQQNQAKYLANQLWRHGADWVHNGAVLADVFCYLVPRSCELRKRRMQTICKRAIDPTILPFVTAPVSTQSGHLMHPSDYVHEESDVKVKVSAKE